MDIAFENIKVDLTSPPVLLFSDFEQHFIVETDASAVAVRVVLSHKRRISGSIRSSWLDEVWTIFNSSTESGNEKIWSSYSVSRSFDFICWRQYNSPSSPIIKRWIMRTSRRWSHSLIKLVSWKSLMTTLCIGTFKLLGSSSCIYSQGQEYIERLPPLLVVVTFSAF